MDDDDKPQDLSMKKQQPQQQQQQKKAKKPIPPPLDLNARTLGETAQNAADLRVPKSPGDLPRECLPIRKRPLLEVRRDLHDDDYKGVKSPKSAGPLHHAFSTVEFRTAMAAANSGGGNNSNTAPSSPLSSAPPRLPIASTLTLTPSSASSLASSVNSAFTHFPVPPPLIPSHLKSPFLSLHTPPTTTSNSGNGSGTSQQPTPPTDLHSPYPWPLMLPQSSHHHPHHPFSPVLPHSPLTFPASALLSPAPSSYPSSTNSSREDLPVQGATAVSAASDNDCKRRYLSATSAMAADSTSPIPSSPTLHSPLRSWSHSWPTPAWQCFVAGTLIRFLIPILETRAPWQRAEDLGLKDRLAMVDSKNSYQYAPNGLVVMKIDVISRTDRTKDESPSRSPAGSASTTISTANTTTNADSNSELDHPPANLGDLATTSAAVLRLRMAPHRGDNSAEILADCAFDHPFFVRDKGWCSAHPRLSIEKYGIPCQTLTLGDICLPPNHPEAVRTPDLCDRFRRFEFNEDFSGNSGASPLARSVTTSALVNRVVKSNQMSPPMSPAKKKESNAASNKDLSNGGDQAHKPKRPMNGFMLFAKKFRLELIQQHPGKDNRAISVLLGEAWKSLPQEEREQYSHKAKLMADEQKKLHPDCWKRKRTVNKDGNPQAGGGPGMPTGGGGGSQQPKTPTSATLVSAALANLPPPPFQLPPHHHHPHHHHHHQAAHLQQAAAAILP